VRIWLRRVIQGVLTVTVTWFIVTRVGVGISDFSELDPAFWRPSWLWLIGSSLLLLGGYLFAASLWGRMVAELGGPAMGFWASCRIFFTANLGRYIPGKVWQIAGLAYLAKSEGVTGSVAVAAAILGQLLSLVGATLVGLVAFLGGDENVRHLGVWALAAGVILLALVSVPQIFRRVLRVWFRLVRKEAPEGIAPGPLFGLKWTALYVVVWVVYGVAFWGLVKSFGLSPDVTTVGAAYAAAYVLGYVAIFAPAGIGVREGFIIVFLEPILGSGSVAIAVISRVWTTLVELGPAAVFAGAYFTGEGRGVEQDE
jgi:uncharacterized membrane protein YbhN (UPF0104 family)